MADGVALRLNVDPDTDLPEYTAQHERFFHALDVQADDLSGLSCREGKRLGPGLECTISGDGLGVVVQPGLAIVKHALNNGGNYRVAIPNAVTKTLAAKPGAGLKRRDAVVLDVSDEDVAEKPTELREANVLVLEGTAVAGTPTAPAAGLMQFEIGRIDFDGTNTPVMVSTNPRYAWAAGGIGVVFSQTERDNLTAHDGMKVYRADLGLWQQRRAGAWEDELGGDDTGWIYADIDATWESSASGTSFSHRWGTRIRRIGNRVRLEITCQWNGGSSLPAGIISPHEPIFDIDDASLRPGTNPEAGVIGENTLAVTVGHKGSGGGMVAFAINPFGVVQVWSTTTAILSGDVIRATFEYFTD